ncbi:hypothetical protein [Paenibacillus sp. GCM10027626]|uniref:hypothetical protein n=1 Tax=Paenibacillus sp. GCM10027626 TaxID=3273411 RepID=UPI003631F258
MGLLFKICRSVHEHDEYTAEVVDHDVEHERDDSPQDQQQLLELLSPSSDTTSEVEGKPRSR